MSRCSARVPARDRRIRGLVLFGAAAVIQQDRSPSVSNASGVPRSRSGTVNLRLGAVRRLAYEAADCGLLSADLAAGIRRVKGVKKLRVRLGNWLTAEQGQALWQTPNCDEMKGKRDRAPLALPRLRPAAARVGGADNRPSSAARRALGDRGPPWQGRSCSHRSRTGLGDRPAQRLDGCGWNQSWQSLLACEQRRQGLG